MESISASATGRTVGDFTEPILYRCNGQTRDNPNLSLFVDSARWSWPNAIGPTPGGLGSLPETRLREGQGSLQLLTPTPSKTVVWGLLTCAAVIYYSTHHTATPGIWCYHANAGVLSAGSIDEARSRLGDPPWDTIVVVYAYARPREARYATQLQKLVNQGIRPGNIIEVSNLSYFNLGVDNQGRLGY
jgi:hypothetical protein